MSEEMIGIIISAILSLISLIISIKSYQISKPKLKIVVTDKKSDVYFGRVCLSNDSVASTLIGAIEISIINNSPVDIFVKDIKLKIGNDCHKLVFRDNPYWEDIYFFFYNENGEKMWDGVGINYQSVGISMPVKIDSYTILSGVCLFHDFPNIDSKSQKGKVILDTAVGKVAKKVKFIKYDKNYISNEMKEVELYRKNFIEK